MKKFGLAPKLKGERVTIDLENRDIFVSYIVKKNEPNASPFKLLNRTVYDKAPNKSSSIVLRYPNNT